MNGSRSGPLTFCGRTFSAGELELMRQIAGEFRSLSLTETARTLRELLNWKRPNGGLKNHECRQLLERLRGALWAQGWLRLPELRRLGPRGPRRVRLSCATDPQPELAGTAGQYEPLRLMVVEGASADSRLCMELIQRYHYSWPAPRANCLVTGSGATATARCCWRPWWTGGGFPAPAIGPPTGFCWVKPKDAVAWTAPLKPMAQLAS